MSGQWLCCGNPKTIKQHQARIYSQAEVGSLPMSAPHLGTRVVGGKKSLLFGSYAGFSTKLLRHGPLLDLSLSIRPGDILPVFSAARDNMDLTRYLISQVMQLPGQCLETLRKFYSEAETEDWRLEIVGQRVRIIKKDPKKGGILQFGIELVAAHDDSIVTLLGASPGVSVVVSIMLGLIERCFPEQTRLPKWSAKLKETFPTCEKELGSDAELHHSVSSCCGEVLELTMENDVQVPVNAE